jgi:hypothetical protein
MARKRAFFIKEAECRENERRREMGRRAGSYGILFAD